MVSYVTNYFHLLDQNDNSTNGKVDELVSNSVSTATETGVGGTVDDGLVTVGEQFNVVFNDVAANFQYGGTYTYIGHSSPRVGFVVPRARPTVAKDALTIINQIRPGRSGRHWQYEDTRLRSPVWRSGPQRSELNR